MVSLLISITVLINTANQGGFLGTLIVKDVIDVVQRILDSCSKSSKAEEETPKPDN